MAKKFVGSREWSDVTRDYPIKKRSLRWAFRWAWDRPRRYMFLGIPESGKSVLNESCALRHPKIWDFYGSKDDEGLCWCRKGSPIDDILLVHGDNTDLKASFDTCPVSKATMARLDGYEAVITTNSFYSHEPIKFQALEDLARLPYARKFWDAEGGDIIYLLMREMMNVIYSKISQGMNEKDAKASLLYFIRELRHQGFSIGGDTLRWTGVDKEFRDLADFTIFKCLGEKGLPREKWFLYNYVKPKAFALMEQKNFVALSVKGSIAWGENGNVSFHKPEGLDILAELDIKIEHGAPKIRSTAGQVGDDEHARIMAMAHEGDTTRAIGAKIGRSNSTISDQIRIHNSEIESRGFCPKCKVADSPMASRRLGINDHQAPRADEITEPA